MARGNEQLMEEMLIFSKMSNILCGLIGETSIRV